MFFLSSVNVILYDNGCCLTLVWFDGAWIDDLFDGAFTITDANFIPKPNIEPYQKIIEAFRDY